jgi:hypothetical protein
MARPSVWKGLTMKTRTVRDVIGEPESWPNDLQGDLTGSPDMFGATVSASFASGDQLAIQTDGSASGMTFVTFNVADADLCANIVAAMWPGRDLYTALAATV